MSTASTLDAAEVAKFDRIAAEWWDPHGKFAPIHKFNPVRLGFIRDRVVKHFGLDGHAAAPLTGLRLLDIGCGGGILCEPMARLGAEVVGVDPSPATIDAACVHARASRLAIDYRSTSVEQMAAAGERFDIVLAMEVVEHVADVDAFIAACGQVLRPDGLMVVATINRTLKAFALAIVGAEYVLRWLPRGTHAYEKFVRPVELGRALVAAGLKVAVTAGVTYSPLTDAWRLSSDTDVNYMLTAEKSAKA